MEESLLSTVGAVWEKGDISMKALSRNNYEATAKFIWSQLNLVSDAIFELEEARSMVAMEIECDDEDIDDLDLRWSDADLLLLGPATGLLKTGKNIVKKIGQTAKEIGKQDVALGWY